MVMTFSDGQGFAKPQGYIGKGVAGKGQGRDNWTPTKPIPSVRVRGYLYSLQQVWLDA